MYGMSEMVQHVEEASEKSIVMLDDYNSDLHLVLDDDGYVIRRFLIYRSNDNILQIKFNYVIHPVYRQCGHAICYLILTLK